MKKFFTLLSLALLGTFTAAAYAPDKAPLLQARDSLNRLLESETDSARRLDLLTSLGDLLLSLDNDYAPVERLWREGVACGDDDAVVGAGKSLALRWINAGQLDSADVWIARCEKEFHGSTAEPSLAYLRMMREIRDLGDLDKLAKELLEEEITLRDGKQPYRSMRTLFMLGILASTEQFTNEHSNARTNREYLEEGYRIACSLPLKESYSFRLQFLVALGSENPHYAEEMIHLRDDYAALSPRVRPYRSRRADLMAYARLMSSSEKLGREKADRYFRKFSELVAAYPYDSPTPLDYYYYKSVLPYYLYIRDYRQALICCDSAMTAAPKYKMGGWQFYPPRMQCREALGDYRGAYRDACDYMEVRDSIAAQKTSDKLMELQARYDVDTLRYENNLKRLQLGSVILLCLILAALAGVMVGYARILRRKNRFLYQQINENVLTLRQLSQIKQEVTIRPDLPAQSDEATLYDRFEQLLSESENYSDPTFNRDRAAAALGTNTTYLSQAIQESSGKSFGEYLTSLRLRRSIEIMQEQPGLPLEEVCQMIGYTSYGGFYAAFRKQYNLSPKKYIEFLQESGSAE